MSLHLLSPCIFLLTLATIYGEYYDPRHQKCDLLLEEVSGSCGLSQIELAPTAGDCSGGGRLIHASRPILPWLVHIVLMVEFNIQLGFGPQNVNISQIEPCGSISGTIISPEWVLTTAKLKSDGKTLIKRCLKRVKSRFAGSVEHYSAQGAAKISEKEHWYVVVAGQRDISMTDTGIRTKESFRLPGGGQKFAVEQKNYFASKKVREVWQQVRESLKSKKKLKDTYDLALLKMPKLIKLERFVKPLCLPSLKTKKSAIHCGLSFMTKKELLTKQSMGELVAFGGSNHYETDNQKLTFLRGYAGALPTPKCFARLDRVLPLDKRQKWRNLSGWKDSMICLAQSDNHVSQKRGIAASDEGAMVLTARQMGNTGELRIFGVAMISEMLVLKTIHSSNTQRKQHATFATNLYYKSYQKWILKIIHKHGSK